jgi:hypothetical protein
MDYLVPENPLPRKLRESAGLYTNDAGLWLRVRCRFRAAGKKIVTHEKARLSVSLVDRDRAHTVFDCDVRAIGLA